jgi:hypothetical protein
MVHPKGSGRIIIDKELYILAKKLCSSRPYDYPNVKHVTNKLWYDLLRQHGYKIDQKY